MDKGTFRADCVHGYAYARWVPDEGVQGAIAEASYVGPFWYINRVFVPFKYRNQKIGSKLVSMLVDSIRKFNKDADIIVEPGGYENNIDRQTKFYKNNGFVDSEVYKDALIWESSLFEISGTVGNSASLP